MSKEIMVSKGAIKTPPISHEARREIGFLIRALQEGETLSMPHSRPMPDIGPRCHELRVKDAHADWRVMYRLDADAVVILDVFSKKTRATPPDIIAKCKKRLREYDVKDGG